MTDEDGGSLAVVKAVGGSALWAAGAAGSYVGGAISSYVAGSSSEVKPREGAEPVCLRPLGGGEILRIANTLNGIFATSAGALKPPEVPRLVVVGTQSSGKSSLLNGIMAADILPLGEQMVTRAPLSLQLFHAPDPAVMRAEFGDFSNGAWRLSVGIPLQCPEPTAAQLEHIRRTIEEQTEARAGSQKGVSHEPIFMRIYSPYVPNLSLVDLPGLTMTALTDKGQPHDIKAQIRGMISTFIEQERTIILLVCPARADLEADPAVELVKEVDPTGKRTVGVLTKVDLMNAGTDVANYLTNAVPADLQLALGYFAIRNRAPAEAKQGGLTVRDGFDAEQAYFRSHPSYGGAPAAVRERLGVPQLSAFLSRVLLLQVKRHMPALIAEVSSLAAAAEQKMLAMGSAVPQDEGSRSALLQTLLASFCKEFVGGLVEKRADVKTGRRIKDAFGVLQASLREVRPFEGSDFEDAYLLEAVRDCEGNHLSFPIPPIELLEHMLQHPEKRPIHKLLAPCLACLQQVHEELRVLCSKQLQHPSIARFPQLQAAIRDVMGSLLQEQQAVAQQKLEELVCMEEAYISTDDPAFLAELQGVMKKLASRLDVGLLRSILSSYHATVQRAISNGAPKAIMCFLVRGTQASVSASLFERIARQPPANVLDEPPEVDAQRRAELECVTQLRAAKRALETLTAAPGLG